MFHLLHRSDQHKGAIAAVEFEGEPYSAGASFFLGDLSPGKGPTLHKHPYSEICIVRSGQAGMTLDGEEVIAGPGDVVVIEPETPHGFKAIGDERLEMLCIHASNRFIIEWLELPNRDTGCVEGAQPFPKARTRLSGARSNHP